MKINIEVDRKSCDDVCDTLEAIVSNVHYGARWATEIACKDIEEMSLAQVPRDTDTLASSIHHIVEKGRRRFVGTVYYGHGNPINPKSGEPVQNYMVRQHEDLEYAHTVGKAKFLEDPCREYANSDKYAELMAEAARRAIARKARR